MPFAELKDNLKIHYHLRGKGVKSGALDANFQEEEDPSILAACEAEGYVPEGAQVGTEGRASVGSMLAVNMPVLTYHYRGSGQSSVPQSLMEYTVEAYREDMRQLASQLGFGKFNLIGYSHGGYFAADYALAYPEQLSALVLVEPALFVDPAKLQERVKLAREGNGDNVIHVLMKQMVPEMAFNSKAYNDLVNAIKYNYPDPIGLAGEWYARSTHEIGETELSQINVPTLVIGGQRSWVRENIERTARSIPGAKQVWLEGTHNLLEERPAEVTAAIESFLAENKSSSTAG
jgi:pimeloyl-ACP methyl ester carboxylesterase